MAISEKKWSNTPLLQLQKYHPSLNLKASYLGLFQSSKLRIWMEGKTFYFLKAELHSSYFGRLPKLLRHFCLLLNILHCLFGMKWVKVIYQEILYVQSGQQEISVFSLDQICFKRFSQWLWGGNGFVQVPDTYILKSVFYYLLRFFNVLLALFFKGFGLMIVFLFDSRMDLLRRKKPRTACHQKSTNRRHLKSLWCDWVPYVLFSARLSLV